jgi:hypothetical protein
MPGGRHLPDTACFPPVTAVSRERSEPTGQPGPVAAMLQAAALPPPDLQARTLARVQQAAAQARPAGRAARLARWRGWDIRMLALAGGGGHRRRCRRRAAGLPASRAVLHHPAVPLAGAGCLRPGGRAPHRRRLVHPAHRRPPQRPRSRPVLRMLVRRPGQPARPPSADHRRYLHRRPGRHRHRSDVERRRPPVLSPPCKSPPKPQATAARAGESFTGTAAG